MKELMCEVPYAPAWHQCGPTTPALLAVDPINNLKKGMKYKQTINWNKMPREKCLFLISIRQSSLQNDGSESGH